MRRVTIILLSLGLVLLLSSCLPGTLVVPVDQPAGFFRGIWHGWVAPVSLVVGLFDPTIRVYESYNTGWWYDLGFYMAVVSGFGSLSLVRKRSDRQKHDR